MSDHHPLAISSYDELRQQESEIVRRINEKPNGGRLLAIDPLRLLEDVCVQLSDRAVADWRSRGGEALLQGSGSRRAYDALAESGKAGKIRFRVRRLLGDQS